MEKPHCSNFRINTAIFWGVQIFQIFTIQFVLSKMLSFRVMIFERVCLNNQFCFHFSGQFDTNWILQATLEKKISEIPLPIVFSLSAMANQAKSDYKFGVGLQMG